MVPYSHHIQTKNVSKVDENNILHLAVLAKSSTFHQYGSEKHIRGAQGDLGHGQKGPWAMTTTMKCAMLGRAGRTRGDASDHVKGNTTFEWNEERYLYQRQNDMGRHRWSADRRAPVDKGISG